MSSAFSRVMNPFEFNPSVGSVKIADVKPGNVEVLNGQSVDVSVEIKNPTNRLYKATLYYTVEGDRELDLAMIGRHDSNGGAGPATVDRQSPPEGRRRRAGRAETGGC